MTVRHTWYDVAPVGAPGRCIRERKQ